MVRATLADRDRTRCCGHLQGPHGRRYDRQPNTKMRPERSNPPQTLERYRPKWTSPAFDPLRTIKYRMLVTKPETEFSNPAILLWKTGQEGYRSRANEIVKWMDIWPILTLKASTSMN